MLNKRLYKIYKLSKNKSTKQPLIVLIHGYGSNENDLFSFNSLFDENLNIVSYRATKELYQNMYAWYDIYFENNVKSFDVKTAIQSTKLITEEIKLFCNEYNCDENRVTLIGFSQGAILGYSILFLNPNLLKNLVALSGYVEEKILERNYIKTNTSIYVSHGKNDETIPFDDSRKTLQLLDSKKIKYDFFEFNQGHGVSQENLYSILNWLSKKY